jgi:hypothetical protein
VIRCVCEPSALVLVLGQVGSARKLDSCVVWTSLGE